MYVGIGGLGGLAFWIEWLFVMSGSQEWASGGLDSLLLVLVGFMGSEKGVVAWWICTWRALPRRGKDFTVV
jgi:hypothetical protein